MTRGFDGDTARPPIGRRRVPVWVICVLTAWVVAGAAACRSADGGSDSLLIEISDASTIEVSGLPSGVLAALETAGLDADGWSRVLRVSVFSGDAALDTGLPAVVGSYAIKDRVIRFTPMFPFDRGRNYTVAFDPGGVVSADAWSRPAPLVAIVGLPALEAAPSTVVERVFPSGDRLPENQLKLYVYFSAPMSREDGLEYIHLVDAEGQEVEAPFLPLGTQFWDRDLLRYTVFFDPGRVKRGIRPNEELGRALTAGGTYTIAIDQAWPDGNGNSLERAFQKTFTVAEADMAPVDPMAWTVTVPPAGTREPVVADFGEPLDYGLLGRVLAIEDATDATIAGEIAITNQETQWVFTPAATWQPGRYALVALGILEDLAGNRIGAPFEIDVFERIDAPDEQESYRIPFEIAVR